MGVSKADVAVVEALEVLEKGKKKAGRDSKGRFVKGEYKGGPGRASIPEDIKQMFRSLAPDCCKVLCEIVNDPSARQADRIKAAEVILDRGWGKPVQSVDLDASSIPQVVFVGADNIAD